MWFLFTCDQKLTKNQFSPPHLTDKTENGKLKQKMLSSTNPLSHFGWVQRVGEDLWWEGFVEDVFIESGVGEWE